MAKLNSLLYSSLLFLLLATSSNADWKMFNSKDGTFLYEAKKGIVFKYNDTKKGKQVFFIVPLKAQKYHTSGEELLKNTTPPKP